MSAAAASSTGAERDALGITTNTAAVFEGGEERKRAASGTYGKRWRLQRRAQGLLQGNRVSMCQRGLSGELVTLRRSPDGRYHYGGLLTCGSVWHCPVCASRIAEGRRADLQAAIESAQANGLAAYLLTFTFRHNAGMSCEDSIKNLSDGMRRLTARRAYKRAMDKAGAIGAVRALEVTYGTRNGWHPHVHALVFAKHGALGILEEIRSEWERVHVAVWGTRAGKAGFDARGAEFAADYVAKWGQVKAWSADREMTGGATKKTGRLSGKTPFELLAAFDAGNRNAGALFQEYAEAFHGRRQLVWSPKLRERLGLNDEQTDLDIATEDERRPAEIVAVLDLEDWAAVVRHEARGKLLDVAESLGAEGVRQLLGELRSKRGKWCQVFSIARHFGPGRWEYTDVPALEGAA